MASLFGGKNSQFERLLEKATSPLLLEPDWAAILAICDSIRQNDISAKAATALIRKRFTHENPHVVIYSLHVLESMAKNCGSIVHDEIATKETMEAMRTIIKNRPEPMKGKALELLQIWYQAFKNQIKYKIVQDTYGSLKSEGFKFPALKESDAMFTSEAAPNWKDSESCSRCRVSFSTFRRKHHCRSCGSVFCDECSSKRSIIPRFGIEKEVRVCDSCYDVINRELKKAKMGNATGAKNDLPAEYKKHPLSKEPQSPPPLSADKQRELELQEKEELELALALSASEAENKTRGQPMSQAVTNRPPTATTSNLFTTLDTSGMDPELARYLNRNYWDSKSAENAQPSAPVMIQQQPIQQAQKKTTQQATSATTKMNGESPESNEEDRKQEEFLAALRSSVEIFVNRMKSNSQRGRSIASDSAVQTLFLTLNAMHPQLLQNIKDKEEKRAFYETMQDKLAQLRDAREALTALREEHRERRRQEEEERARQQQILMMQKLEVMRQKKQEYLDYQRQLALQRMQEQERERQMRLEQQIQMQQMRQYQQQYPFSSQQHQQPPQGYTAPNTGYVQPYMSSGAPYMPPGGQGYQMPPPAGAPNYAPQQNYQQGGYSMGYDPQNMNQPPMGSMQVNQQQPYQQAPMTSYPGYAPSDDQQYSSQHHQGMSNQSQGLPNQPPVMSSQPQGMPNQQSQGMPNQPPQGMPNQPPQGIPNQPPQGMPNQPPQGMPNQPPQGMPNPPSQGIPSQPQNYSQPGNQTQLDGQPKSPDNQLISFD